MSCHRRSLSVVAIAAAVACVSALAGADVKLNALFTNHMVLQRNQADAIWGTAKPDAEVRITLTDGKGDSHEVKAKAGSDGRFDAELPELDVAKNPYRLNVNDGDSDVAMTEVLAGDVWVCSGQSNMGFNVNNTLNRDAEIAAADYPTLRLFTVPNVGKADPVDDISTQPWTATTPKSIPNFSAVAYFFGRRLNKDLNVPIGLIHTSWGGTPAEAWTPLPKLEMLAKDGLKEVARMVENRRIATSVDGKQRLAEAQAKYKADFEAWLRKAGRWDNGPTADAAGWEKADLDDSSWKTVTVPHNWIASGEANGCAWYRRTIDVPANQAGQPMTMYMGSIDDADTTWFNGEQVGTTDQMQPNVWQIQRIYKVPPNLVKAGKNTIAIRVWDTGGGAGLAGPTMTAGVGDTKIVMTGEWKWKRESTLAALNPDMPQPQVPTGAMQLDHPNAPASLYNGMIHPLGKFGIKGAIWYQGETNAARAGEYERLLTTMIGAWRDQFDQGDFPFYIVGLANFQKPTDDPNQFSDWAMLRDAQRATAEHVKHSAMSVTIDVGEATDIHPKNKQAVGDRLALLALHDTYHKDIVSRGPTLAKADFDDGKVVLHFANVGGGLKAIGDSLKSFAIAGDDGRFAWADAKIDGDTVVLTANGIAQPKQAKYAFANNPTASLFNAEGLPAEPFSVKK